MQICHLKHLLCEVKILARTLDRYLYFMNFSFAWLVVPSQYGMIKFCSLKMIKYLCNLACYRNFENRVCQSLCLSFHLSGHFLGIVSLFFSKFWHGSRKPHEVVRDRAGFSGEKKFCPRNWENGPKTGFF